MKITAAAMGVLISSCGFHCAALADDAAYAFKVENVSGAAAVVTMDAMQVCALAPAGTCTVSIPDGNHHDFAFSVGGGAPVAFQPGNPELVDVCKLEAKAAHCIDPSGAPTN